MGCTPLPGGGFACSRGSRSKPCKEPGCGRASIALCDWPLGGPRFGQTCSREMCATHRHKQPGKNIDFCPVHDRYAKQPHVFCPRCHMPSCNPNDIEKKYCGYCHEFHDRLHLMPPVALVKDDGTNKGRTR